LVVAVDPFLSNFTNLLERFKDVSIEYFMTAGMVKAFNKGILLWVTRLDKLELDAFFLAPAGKDHRA
jgi:hypothetical protein